MAKILLLGAFGQGNPGDEALFTSTVDALAGHDIVVASGAPELTANLRDVRTIRASPVATARAAWASDAIVVGGGTTFKALHPSSGRSSIGLLRNTAMLVAGARARGIPVAMIGVGADDLRSRSARRYARWLVRNLDLLVLRDEESASVLADAGAERPFWVGADLVWSTLDQLSLVGGSTPAEPTIVVALSHLAGDRRLLDGLSSALAACRDDYAIELQPWQVSGPAADLAMATELNRALGGAATIIDPPASVLDAAQLFAGRDLVVCLRFHALVAAGMALRPSLAVAHEPKLAGLSRRLRQLSVPAHAAPEVYRGVIRAALRSAPPEEDVAKNEAVQAARTFDLVRLLLDQGGVDRPEDVAAPALSWGGGSW